MYIPVDNENIKIKYTYDFLKMIKKRDNYKDLYKDIKKRTLTNLDIFDIEDEKEFLK